MRGLQASRMLKTVTKSVFPIRALVPSSSSNLSFTQPRYQSTGQVAAPQQNPAPGPDARTATRIPRPRSSVPVGQPLKGINFEKSKQDPVAKADSEYPDWLWTLLDRQAVRKDEKEEESDEAALYCMLRLESEH